MRGRPTGTDRLIAKLSDPHATFTPAQVAYLMGAAAQWARDVIDGEPSPLSYRAGLEDGYRARVAEENAAYPPPPYSLVSTAGEDARRVHGGRCGVDAAEPREGDFAGFGPEYVAELRERWAFDDVWSFDG